MIKYMLVVGALLSLTACETIKNKFEAPSCTERVAIASHTVVMLSDELVLAVENNNISIKDAPIALDSIDAAMNIIDSASSFCSLDESVADNYINAVYVSVQEISKLIGDE